MTIPLEVFTPSHDMRVLLFDVVFDYLRDKVSRSGLRVSWRGWMRESDKTQELTFS
jgi:hypothetical protein